MSNLQLTQEKLNALRSEYKPRRPCAQLKYPRPKTKPEYQSLYPWIILDETDPHFVFCAICECRLSAKRSDLGKHEGSIKHSENSQRKSAETSAAAPSLGLVKWEYNEEEDGEEERVDSNRSLLVCKREAIEEEEEDEEDDEEEDEAEASADHDYEPHTKRRASETDSQHSGLLDYLPLQVTINEVPHHTSQQQLTTASGAATHCPPPCVTPQPCRITIKKVTTPLLKLGSAATSSQPQNITSKATITPIATPLQSYQLQQFAPRDSLELFFDSICSTVKSLPPKLATEGKIRVMQLIGELELRAISEREALPGAGAANGMADAVTVAASAAEVPGSSQQIATVASTTK